MTRRRASAVPVWSEPRNPAQLKDDPVLATLKDASCRADAPWPAAILDRGHARRWSHEQAGTKKRLLDRTKKRDRPPNRHKSTRNKSRKLPPMCPVQSVTHV